MENCAVIVDSRPIDPMAIENHLKFLPGWRVIVFSGHKIDGYECRNCPPISNLNQYNQFLTSEHFWNKLEEFNRALIFQQDSRILRPGVDEFLEWDYVGSPWKWQQGPRKGGNGGLSLRNPKKCLELVKKKPWSITYGYEDVYFTNHLEEVGGKVAPYEVCKKWGCETMFELGTFGYHAISKYLSANEVNKIKTQYDIVPV